MASRAARTAAVAALTAALWALAAGQAAAQVAPCDPASAPMLGFRDLPDQLIFGRKTPFGLNADDSMSSGWVDSDVQIAMAENGTPFWTGAIGEFDISDSVPQLFIRTDEGDAPLTVTASYTEYRLNTYPTPSGQCARQIAKTVAGVTGSRLARPTVTGNDEEGKFLLSDNTGTAEDDDCETEFAPSPLAVQVRPLHARRWTTAAVADQCYGFQRAVSGPGFRLAPESELRSILYFQPRTAARDSVKDFQFRIMEAAANDDGEVTVRNRSLRRGMLRVTTRHTPSRRVYGFKSNGATNDEYWNYCVNEGKKVWMHNGNPYCIRPSSTTRRVTVRR